MFEGLEQIIQTVPTESDVGARLRHAIIVADALERLIERYGQLATIVRAVPGRSDITAQAQYLSEAGAALPWINELWVEAQMVLNAKRAEVSEEYCGEKWRKMSKRLVENLIDGRCGLELRVEGLYGRLSRSAVHCTEMVRSLLSNSKAERATSRFGV